MSFIINPYRFATGANDPYWSSVGLLLHCDGSNGSTTFTDSSSFARTVTANGNAQVSTSVKKFGTGSVLLDGNDYLSVADASEFDFGSGDFTVECFCYVTNTASRTIISKWTTSGQRSWYLGAGTTGFGFYFSTNGTNSTLAIALTAWPSTSTWFHIAVTRSGADLRLFVDGVQQGSTYNISTTSLFNGNGDVTIGDDASTNAGFTGNIDEVRITKGVARYTANFTPPSAPFPDS